MTGHHSILEGKSVAFQICHHLGVWQGHQHISNKHKKETESDKYLGVRLPASLLCRQLENMTPPNPTGEGDIWNCSDERDDERMELDEEVQMLFLV